MLSGALRKLTDWISLYQVQVSGGCHKNRSLVQGYNLLSTLLSSAGLPGILNSDSYVCQCGLTMTSRAREFWWLVFAHIVGGVLKLEYMDLWIDTIGSVLYLFC